MNGARRAATAAVCASILAAAGAVQAAGYTVTGGRLSYFADGLLIVGRGATGLVAGPVRAGGDACSVDLRTNRVLVAGHAWLERDGHRLDADAITVDLDDGRVDLFDLETGATRTTLAFAPPATEPTDARRFAFPDVAENRAYIRARRAAIVPHASARFSPATFPTSVGALPVPSYLVDFAVGTGWGAQSLSGATFDQPYHLAGTTHALTSLHARYIDGTGPALAVDEHLVASDDAYVVASVDAVNRPARVASLNGYRRIGATTFNLDGTANATVGYGHAGVTLPLRRLSGRLDYQAWTSGGSAFDAALRGPDLPLALGFTWRPRIGLGFDAQSGGLLSVLRDRANYATVWRHDAGFSVASPVVAGPLGVRLGGTIDASRRWYAFPHKRDLLTTSATATRAFSRAVSTSLTYTAGWGADDFPGNQRLFYPAQRLVTPDGTPWPGYGAFAGATVTRGFSFDVTDAPVPDVSLRASLRTADDFPQFRGYGRPPTELRFDVRFRPLPNVGVTVGRAYDFDWGGTRWQPRWTFAILP